MSPVSLRNFGFPRNQPEDRQGMFGTKRSGSGSYCGLQKTHRNHSNASINLPIKQESQTRGLEEYGSSSSAPQTPQRLIKMEHGQQEVKTRIKWGRTLENPTEDISPFRDLMEIKKRLESPEAVQTPGRKGSQDKGNSSYYLNHRGTV
ncbi:hypothetical protein O181_000823 [Austropuccinia psidii MF-1]|uniref:Uncharacterized protein n=1 Tax=Austropuccinia psidii MF-1 TaxID=1389203 RepID=A0A9Q3GB69_9BASI|nr:hypothetical protein [Austropuccinia psidii MF-1]